MNFQELSRQITKRADDTNIEESVIKGWINRGIEAINVKLETSFPDIVDIPVFDKNYHDALVYFAVARYKESDSAISEANYFDSKFLSMLRDMETYMKIQPRYCAGDEWVQITVTDITQKSYPIDFNYNEKATVYINDVKTNNFSILNGMLNLSNMTLQVGAVISINIEKNNFTNEAPYEHWNGLGW